MHKYICIRAIITKSETAEYDTGFRDFDTWQDLGKRRYVSYKALGTAMGAEDVIKCN